MVMLAAVTDIFLNFIYVHAYVGMGAPGGQVIVSGTIQVLGFKPWSSAQT